KPDCAALSSRHGRALHGILDKQPILRSSYRLRRADFSMIEGARRYKYLDALTTMFVVILLVSNLVAQKICLIGPFAVSGAVLLFPITYIFGDVFTEV